MARSRTELAWLTAALAACGAASSGAPGHATEEAHLLGPLPRSGCFHVALVAPRRYRFMIDDVEYPRGLGAGWVAVLVHATDMGELQPQPILLARDRQLCFEAEGDASGAFELTLFLGDGRRHASEPATLERICDALVRCVPRPPAVSR